MIEGIDITAEEESGLAKELGRRLPLVGSIVQFLPRDNSYVVESGLGEPNEWSAAIVTKVYRNGDLVELTYFADMGKTVWARATKGKDGGCWRWPQ